MPTHSDYHFEALSINADLKGQSNEKIMTLNHRLGPNLGTPTLFQFLKSPFALLRIFK
jgi:hypothetical protein